MREILLRISTVSKTFIQIPSRNDLQFSVLVTVVYGVLALLFGLSTKLFTFTLYSGDIKSLLALPFILLIIPSIPEEFFFRGMLLPHRSEHKTKKQIITWIMISMTAFVLWHPFAALTTYKQVRELFTDWRFITIVTMLSFSCTITYLKTGNIWIPTVIHWLTVIVWMLFLGGRNFALDMV